MKLSIVLPTARISKITPKFRTIINSYKLQVGITLLLGFLIYSNTLNNAMFWDDNDFILNNNFIKNWKYLPRYFSENVIAGSGLLSDYWRPLLLLVFSFQWSIWGNWVTGYHLTNLVMHLLNGFMIYKLTFKLFKHNWSSFLVSLIFVIHPLQTEAVAYANSLGDSLSIFFLLLSFIAFVNSIDKQKTTKFMSLMIKSLCFFCLALMSKETAVVGAPIVFIIYIFKQNNNEKLKNIYRSFKNTWPFFFILINYFILRATVLNFKNTFNLYNESNEFTSNILLRLIFFCKIFYKYISLLFIPINLHMERFIERPKSIFEIETLVGLTLIVLTLFIVFYSYFKNSKLIWFGSSWFIICIVPISNIIVPINGLIYEHWMYFPLVGFVITLIGLFIKIDKKINFGNKSKTLIVVLLALYLSFYTQQTIIRNNEWEDPIKFYEKTLEYSKNNYKLLNNLGMEYAEKGLQDKAEEYYKKAIEIDQKNPVAIHNLANTYASKGNFKEAEESYLRAINLDNNFIFSKNALAKLYLQKNNFQALEFLVLEHKAQSVDDFIIMSNIGRNFKDYSFSDLYLNKALDLDPHNRTIINLIEQNSKLLFP